MPSPYLTMRQAAEYLNISLRSLYADYQVLGIPYYRFGSRVRFLREDLDTWSAANRVTIS